MPNTLPRASGALLPALGERKLGWMVPESCGNSPQEIERKLQSRNLNDMRVTFEALKNGTLKFVPAGNQ